MAAGRVVDPAIDFCTEGCPPAESRWPQPRSPTPRTDPEGQFVYISDGRDRENNDRDLGVTAGNWLSQHGGRSATGGETVLPRQNRLFPVWCLPCAVELPTRVAASTHTARAPSPPPPPAVAHPARRGGGGSSFSWCSGPPPRRGPKLRIVLRSPTLDIHGQGRLSSQPWGRARSHALSPAGCSPSLREPRGGQTLSLSGLTRGFIGWWS